MTTIDTTHQLEASRLKSLAEEIGEEVRLAEEGWRNAVGHAIEAGEKLIEAKSLVKHGEWLPWLERHFPGSDRTARTYMRMARKSATVADLPTVREAVALLTESKEKTVLPAGPGLRVLQVENALHDIQCALDSEALEPRVSRATVEVAVALVEWFRRCFEWDGAAGKWVRGV